MESIKSILMSRDGMSEHEAQNLIDEYKEDLMQRISEGDIFES